MNTGYPSQWEADVVMIDGGTGHLRPIQPKDAERLVAFHNRLSAETIRYRFFAPHPTLSPAEVEDFTQVDHDQRVALVAVLGEDLVAVGRYDRIPGTDVAEVAFVVDDAQQGRGWGSVLLEHLAAIASERGVRRFEADVLTDNVRMVRVFVDAGYQATRSYGKDAIHLVFPIEPTAASIAVMQSREHRAEARSIGRLLSPRSIAVVGRESKSAHHRSRRLRQPAPVRLPGACLPGQRAHRARRECACLPHCQPRPRRHRRGDPGRAGGHRGRRHRPMRPQACAWPRDHVRRVQ